MSTSKPIILIVFLFTFFPGNYKRESIIAQKPVKNKYLLILGVAQDAGYPQAGCNLSCCAAYWNGKELKKLVTSLAIVDESSQKFWLIDATPDITVQLHNVSSHLNGKQIPDGIFLTHAHIGHYTGLMQLGREAMNTSNVPVYAMPKMKEFLELNGPWSQLVTLKNISIDLLKEDFAVQLGNGTSVTPVIVPHRDEFSETVGYRIISSNKKILFIPDIDKWQKWKRNIVEEVKANDVLLLDGTFYKNGEIARDMKEIPHPFIEETMKLFSSLDAQQKSKIQFIHLNHTNPLLRDTPERNTFLKSGFKLAQEGEIIPL